MYMSVSSEVLRGLNKHAELTELSIYRCVSSRVFWFCIRSYGTYQGIRVYFEVCTFMYIQRYELESLLLFLIVLLVCNGLTRKIPHNPLGRFSKHGS